MQIVIVEDRPWKMVTSIQNIRESGIKVEDIIFVCSSAEKTDQTKEKLSDLKKNLSIRIESTDRYHFAEVMDRFYLNKNNLFFCDLNLSGERREFFNERVNVKYATEIMKKEEGRLKRIWFYTTAGESTNEQINTNFKGRNISVKAVKQNQVILDMEEIQKALKKYEQDVQE